MFKIQFNLFIEVSFENRFALMGRWLLTEGMKEYGYADLQDTAEQTGNISSNCGWRQEPGRM